MSLFFFWFLEKKNLKGKIQFPPRILYTFQIFFGLRPKKHPAFGRNTRPSAGGAGVYTCHPGIAVPGGTGVYTFLGCRGGRGLHVFVLPGWPGFTFFLDFKGGKKENPEFFLDFCRGEKVFLRPKNHPAFGRNTRPSAGVAGVSTCHPGISVPGGGGVSAILGCRGGRGFQIFLRGRKALRR